MEDMKKEAEMRFDVLRAQLVDLVAKHRLNETIRDQVLRDAQILYAA
jgi:hypothetical protein